ncbi:MULTISPECIES: hypothetical protein [unclassified Marinobacterium]|uniref:hypothetical protein n=1 Tax=unclassified Marinobacterium TaxID=2644139 RepID=UPI00156936B6|nr:MULTISPECIES: hypothetical protein [unclassified Marinobacterium]NRP53833.1 hypothetical protein [Marinobacterium sp. xm-v-242]NRP58424.1 hypothetical protein [Marinobacterium sp. xm-d-510]NRP60643.1 hypothetical protein [Marinobacterium sp. xm-d-564]
MQEPIQQNTVEGRDTRLALMVISDVRSARQDLSLVIQSALTSPAHKAGLAASIALLEKIESDLERDYVV